MNQELHEKRVRAVLETTVKDYEVASDLIGLPTDTDKHYVLINRDDVTDLCYDIYQIVWQEMQKYGGHF